MSAKDHFRQQYYEIIDLLVSELKRRFNQPAFPILHEIERLIADSCNGSVVKPSSAFKKMYAADLDIDQLVVQLAMLLDVVRTANTEQKMGIRSDKNQHSL